MVLASFPLAGESMRLAGCPHCGTQTYSKFPPPPLLPAAGGGGNCSLGLLAPGAQQQVWPSWSLESLHWPLRNIGTSPQLQHPGFLHQPHTILARDYRVSGLLAGGQLSPTLYRQLLLVQTTCPVISCCVIVVI